MQQTNDNDKNALLPLESTDGQSNANVSTNAFENVDAFEGNDDFERKLDKNDFSAILERQKRVFAQNFFKLGIALFVLLFLCEICLMLVNAMLITFVATPLATIAAPFFMYLQWSLLFTFFYGFSVMTFCFVARQNAVMGHLFCGFYSAKRMAKSAIPGAVLFALILFASAFYMAFSVDVSLLGDNLTSEAFNNLLVTLSKVALIAIGAFVLAYFPFCLYNFVLYTNPNKNVMWCIKTALKLFKTNFSSIITLLFKALWLPVVALVALAFASTFLQGLASIFSIAQFVLVLALQIKATLTFASIYYHLFSPKLECIEQNNTKPDATGE